MLTGTGNTPANWYTKVVIMSDLHIHLKDLPDFVPCEGYHGKLVHTDLMTVAHWNILANHVLPEHAHPQQQIVNMIEGEFELTVAGEPVYLQAGDVYIIPGEVTHSGRALTNCRIIDVWHPCREDYKTLSPA